MCGIEDRYWDVAERFTGGYLDRPVTSQRNIRNLSTSPHLYLILYSHAENKEIAKVSQDRWCSDQNKKSVVSQVNVINTTSESTRSMRCHKLLTHSETVYVLSSYISTQQQALQLLSGTHAFDVSHWYMYKFISNVSFRKRLSLKIFIFLENNKGKIKSSHACLNLPYRINKYV